MSKPSLLSELIDAFCCLPGVGPKSAQRMVFHLLERNRPAALHMAEKLKQAMEKIGHCDICRTFSENNICLICENKNRDQSKICIVETPADVMALEQLSVYKGLYFVLMGHLSPLDGIGPAELGLEKLQARINDIGIGEVILATNLTVEGEATAHYIMEMIKKPEIKVSRIAHGVPLGGELEYIDGGTLSHAFSERKPIMRLRN